MFTFLIIATLLSALIVGDRFPKSKYDSVLLTIGMVLLVFVRPDFTKIQSEQTNINTIQKLARLEDHRYANFWSCPSFISYFAIPNFKDPRVLYKPLGEILNADKDISGFFIAPSCNPSEDLAPWLKMMRKTPEMLGLERIVGLDLNGEFFTRQEAE